jgi:hypothetical protein
MTKHKWKTLNSVLTSQFPQFKIYDGDKFVASCKELEDSAMIATLFIEGNVRFGHSKKNTLWTVTGNPETDGNYEHAACCMLSLLKTMVASTGPDRITVSCDH